jgi:hypothetical protein
VFFDKDISSEFLPCGANTASLTDIGHEWTSHRAICFTPYTAFFWALAANGMMTKL